MRDALHRILSGGPRSRMELIAAGVFVFVWFAMDFVEWVDWLQTKIWPIAPICVVQSSAPIVPGYYCGSHNCGIDAMPGIPAPGLSNVQVAH